MNWREVVITNLIAWGSKVNIRRDTVKQWEHHNPILNDKELGMEIETQKIKVGDGIHTFKDLPYYKPLYEKIDGNARFAAKKESCQNNITPV